MAGSELLLYQTEDGQTRVQVRLENETVWLNQKQLAELFQKDVRTINEHIQNIYEEGELQPAATIRNFRIVQSEGGREVERDITFYNLDVTISAGYRVRSHRGTQFRIWATQRLREFIVKGFTLDDERLKEGGWTDTYFDELLERVREIRASERLFYKKVCEIYATSVDYDAHLPATREFFATIQNKFHYAIHGHTAAELIAERAKGRCTEHGAQDLDRGQASQGRYRGSKERLGPRGDRAAQPHRGAVSVLCRVTSPVSQAHDHAGLDREGAWVPAPERPGDPEGRGPHQPRVGQGAGGVRIREVRREASHREAR